jgi:hypothetical protein
MDFKERLARLKERRDPEGKEDWDSLLDASLPKNEDQMGELVKMLSAERVADNTDPIYNDMSPADLAALIASADPEETNELIDLVGGLEMFQEYRAFTDEPLWDISQEDYREKLAALLERIIAFIKRWIREITSADLRMSVSTMYYQTLVDNVRVEARSRVNKKQGASFTIESRVPNLCVNYRPLKDSVAILNALTSLEKIVGLYFRTYVPKVLDNARGIITAAATLSQTASVAQLMSHVAPTNTFTGDVFRTVGTHTESLHMMGNHKLVITNNAGMGDQVDQLTGIRIKLDQSQLTPPPQPAVIDIPYFDVSTVNTITGKLDTILNHLAYSNTGRYRSMRRHALTDLATTLERAKNNLVNDPRVDEDRVKEITSLLETFIAWIADPYVGFYAYILRDVRAVINVCAANISQ